jgi:hypothetical protein
MSSVEGIQVVSALCCIGAVLITCVITFYIFRNRQHSSIVARGFFFCSWLLVFSLIAQFQFYLSQGKIIAFSDRVVQNYVIWIAIPLILSLDGIYLVNISSLMFKLQVTQELIKIQKHSNQKHGNSVVHQVSNRWFVNHRYLVNSKFLFLYSFIWIFLCVVVPLVDWQDPHRTGRAKFADLVLAIFVLALLLFYLVKIRVSPADESDRWGLRLELLLMFLIMILQMVFLLLIVFIEDIGTSGRMASEIVCFLILNALIIVCVGIPAYHGEQERKKGIDVLGAEDGFSKGLEDMADKGFEDFLEDPRFYALFRNHLASEMCVENLLFWSAVKKFKQKVQLNVQAESLTPETMEDLRQSFLQVYKSYIADGAAADINIPYEERNKIKVQGLAVQNRKLPDDPKECVQLYLNVFTEAEQTIFYLMRDDPFKRFLRSAKFNEYREQTVSERVLLKNPSGKLMKNGSFRSPSKGAQYHTRNKSGTKDSSTSGVENITQLHTRTKSGTKDASISASGL